MPGASFTVATGINNSGVIVGVYEDQNGNDHGFLDKGGVFTTLDVPGGAGFFTDAFGINNAGQVVGQYFTADFNLSGFVYSDGVFTTLQHPGTGATQPEGINDLGQVVGT